MAELLAPAGNIDKLYTAFHFGADAVYIGGADYSLRAYADNFSPEDIRAGIDYAHSIGRKVYVAVNIFPKDSDFAGIEEYLKFLESVKADAVIASDLGVIDLALKYKTPVHVSTQANIINGRTAKVYERMGVNRLILARELSINDMQAIRDMVEVELEAFVHGAMCISMSGRCLLSNYLSNRDSNRGECVQACRWEYLIREKGRGSELTMEEDKRGTYIMNSRDMNMLSHLKEIESAGISSFKIEGRMKSQYYVGNVVNAYRRAMDGVNPIDELQLELLKNSHRGYTTGFYLDEKDREDRDNSQSVGTYDFVAEIKAVIPEGILVEQRNRFAIGDELQLLSAGTDHNKRIIIDKMYDIYGNIIEDAKLVQQEIIIPCNLRVAKHDILRKKA
jgi:putative protease